MPATQRITSSLRRAVLFGLSLVLGIGISIGALAQTSSSAVINIVVPYGPGGPTDLTARILSVQLQNILKRSVIVVNKPGAGSAIGARAVASAAPDGNTLLLGNVSTFSIVPATVKRPGYDPVKSFVPIVKVADFGAVLIVPESLPVNSLKELVAYAKANPGKAFFGSAGIGNSAHLLGELLKAEAKVDIVHVPYKGGAESLTAIRSGQVQILFSDVSTALGMIQEKQVKALAVTGATRLPMLPNVPTMIESGYPNVQFSNWSAVAAPAGTDPAIIAKYEAAFNQAMATPEFQAYVAKGGGEAKPSSSKDIAALIAAEYKKWGSVAKAAGVSLE